MALSPGLHEEPPHELDQEALEVALMIALMIGASPVDETHVMRKVVIDGSTPFGFQRTAIVAVNGGVECVGRKIPIQTVCVEEDACRKIREKGKEVSYRLDRLGIPLIEVVTGPDITSPKETEEVALTLGQILRATGRVKRGLGTIRQDVNISIRHGALVEIKGVQDLDLLARVVRYEVQRQLSLLEIIEELNRRGVKAEEIEETFVDVTAIFKNTRSPVLRKGIERGHKILAVVLPKFAGLLGKELCPGLRLGTELSDYAKFWGKVGGIFHTDEMPAYGITQDEVKMLRERMETCKRDAIVLIVGEPGHASDALRSVVNRSTNAVSGIPSETRGVHPDGVSHFSRPRPGAARMYPETDVPSTTITERYLERIAKCLPEDPKAKISRLIKKYRLNKKLANQLLNSDYGNLFEEITSTTRVKPSYIAATLTETFRSMLRDNIEITILSDEVIKEVFTLIDKRRIAKEAVKEVFTWMVKHEDLELDNAIKALNLIMISDEDLSSLVENVVQENQSIIQERKEYAFGPLMGIVMKEVRGRVDAKRVSQLLRDKICEMTQR